MKIISLDTETNGSDFKHGFSTPFLVSTCNLDGEHLLWHWRVDPYTRETQVNKNDIEEIRAEIVSADKIVFQNARFDIRALATVGIYFSEELWEKVEDTLIGDHLIDSGRLHDLTTLALIYLNKDISPQEDNLKKAVNRARSLARSYNRRRRKNGLTEVLLATEGIEGLPSAKGDMSKYCDYWLPREMTYLSADAPKTWKKLVEEYNLADTYTTLGVYVEQQRMLQEQKLMPLYRERLRMLRVVHQIEESGVTFSRKRLMKLKTQYERECVQLVETCKKAAPTLKEIPKGSRSNHLMEVMFKDLKLPVVARSQKTGEPSIGGPVMEIWKAILPEESNQIKFVFALADYRKRMTAISYMNSYVHAGLDLDKDWGILYPSLNPTTTRTLRFSSSNPNEQNISKKPDFNLRYAFGPLPGREWWSLDYENIELRIPAYEANETIMIDLFEHPDDPPYFGSNHLLAAHILHDEDGPAGPIFEECCRLPDGTLDGRLFKKEYAGSWYQWTKNGDFAVQYGAMEEYGTADRAFHVKGGHKKIEQRFQRIKKLNGKCIDFAQKHGYIETLLDRNLPGAERGYPLRCEFNYGRVVPTIPLNYRTQGTAMWAMCKAKVRCYAFIRQWNSVKGLSLPSIGNPVSKGKLGAFITMQVHDELVFDFPYRPNKGNLPIVMKLKRLMEKSGDDIGIPLRVSTTYHKENWSEGEEIKTDKKTVQSLSN